jgi:hypothetical protein
MNGVTTTNIHSATQNIDLIGVSKAVDAAEGNGTISIALAKMYPEKSLVCLKCPSLRKSQRKMQGKRNGTES